jgi:hypothetical protein
LDHLKAPVSAGAFLFVVNCCVELFHERASGKEARMARALLIIGLMALAIGLLLIGQGLGVINWPQSSFMIRQMQWAGYGAALAALGLILIWQSKR